ncbi:MAG TPA: peroxiredoxin, partial [Zunongwangia profunda]|nr:peroxiredoxin [Zunongwangia profunda]
MTTLKTGDKAPDFAVEDQDGNLIKLSDFKGKKLVLFFYPKASTPGCTAEACNLRDNWEVFKEKGYAILGVSADSKRRQTNFKAKNELPFP